MLKRRITIRSYTWLISLPLPIVTDLIIASPAHSSKHSVAIRMRGVGVESSDVEVPRLLSSFSGHVSFATLRRCPVNNMEEVVNPISVLFYQAATNQTRVYHTGINILQHFLTKS
ncbi:hypothetical protein CEXT_449581 [Caerostris extrusa]|uniref:Secreted protein n=1 Tax=Caerostris extrusa TaxID=172846 RepID=A0AAV4WEB9_CAEEX|nr:hypothetical protein CEXT_449581 [Caerostris extrusa]